MTPLAPDAFGRVLVRSLHSLFWIGLLWLAAAGYGRLLCRHCLDNTRSCLVTQLALGMAVLLIGFWLGAWLVGWLTGSAWVLCLTGLWLFVHGTIKNHIWSKLNTSKSIPWTWLWLAPPTAMLLIAACCPPGTLWRVEAFGYDVTSYHLQLPREWISRGWMAGLDHNVYSYLPGLMESAYLLIGSLEGSVEQAVYTSQFFHATLALLAAAVIGKTVTQWASKPAGVGVAVLFLSVPWVIITGSLAYNEMGVMVFGAAAMLLIFSDPSQTRGGAAATGLLVAAATLCKLTAGVMIAVPVGLILLTGLNRHKTADEDTNRPHAFQLAAIATLVGLLTLCPYFIRNDAQTGNPVFPFAAEQLGQGHWSDELADRWDQGHGLAQNHEGKFDSLARQWLLNTGYGALGGKPTPRESQNIARFDREAGVPILWIAVAVASVLVMTHKDTRRIGYALLIMLVIQVGFWLFLTHLQSRFLLPTLLPATVLCGLGFTRLRELTLAKAPTVAPLIGSAVLISLIAASYITLNAQTHTLPDPVTGEPLQLPIYTAINTDIKHPDHPINRLPVNSKVLLVADNSGLLYLQRPFLYASAFDEAPLGRFIREAKHDPQKVNQLLQDAGITHIWVHWAELSRLHNTYGHDPDVTVDILQQLIATGWQPIESDNNNYTLFALPENGFPEEGAEHAEKEASATDEHR